MLIRYPDPIAPSEITPREVYLNRRQFMGAGAAMTLALLGPTASAALPARTSPYSTAEEKNTLKEISSYNNFYEFGTAKSDPAEQAHTLKTRPWSVLVDGEAGKPRRFSIEELLKLAPLEERIYRLRCVEGWSMVIPWVGFPLAALLKQVDPTSRAKYVAFETLADPAQVPGVRERVLDWPYREGLRIDEAMHPLTILAVGLYGDILPKQNGAPIRLVVPWKYGFKSSKSIVRIRLQETQPPTSWSMANPREYGFYSNVNPTVDHPRWSQASERRIGELFRRKTLMFNGYADQVAGLYKGMDLKRFY
ncbi:protein-methionine-sulfoxide reductase catalytic subunit MsrP [Chitinilyticum litopenaei]|uniref:protein-methionine-sulfoxide reductase catalytic subunit MsrP n=1 Tax=Chitinilyticum litopenaei TaxID=1121276 RepID=UPI00041C00E6|nr:protein-methionine-sulfoxide reductase catalytic subunit MsrP [Chitinilyticum litopenaei]